MYAFMTNDKRKSLALTPKNIYPTSFPLEKCKTFLSPLARTCNLISLCAPTCYHSSENNRTRHV